MHSIFIVSNHSDSSRLLSKFLEDHGFNTALSSSGRDGLKRLEQHPFDVVLCAMELSDVSGLDMLKEIQAMDPEIPVILIAERGNTREAMQACWKGVWDYLSRPIIPEELLESIKEALLTHKSQPDHLPFITGQSEAIAKVMRDVKLVATTDMSVLISGETGSGKEFLAREIYKNSQRKDQNFVAVDCGSLSKELAGSQLFGHKKGAFTGAVADKKGCFEMADKGTLFLDEIANLSPENQIRLLRVLQERRVQAIGAEESIPVDVRLIVASNENLQHMVSNGTFRQDLFYRINEFPLHLPALRERQEDIEEFANHFLANANQQLDKKVKGFTENALDLMRRFDWPGNLRQLKNEVKRLVLRTSDYQRIDESQLPEEITEPDRSTNESIIEKSREEATGLSALVREVEVRSIINALENANYNKTEAARNLEIDRKTLYNKLELYKIPDKAKT